MLVVLQVRLAARAGSLDKLVSAVVNNRRRFPNVREVVRCRALGSPKSYAIVTYRSGYAPSAADIAKITSAYMDLGCVAETTVIGTPDKFAATTFGNALHFFFDVDSTLTESNSLILNKVRKTFRKMVRDGHRIYLVSGRHGDQIRMDAESLGIEPMGIAENGGIITLTSPSERIILGDRTEPDEVLHYMKINCPWVREDTLQAMRITERIFLKGMPESKFREHIKKSKANADMLSSKTSYHVAKRGVNKGFALENLKAHLKFGEYDVVVGVGDSDLDVSMFDKSDWSFAVHNATRRAKKAATSVLEGSYGDGVAEIYNRWL